MVRHKGCCNRRPNLHGSAPVEATAKITGPILWQGRQRAVTNYKPESRDERSTFNIRNLSELAGGEHGLIRHGIEALGQPARVRRRPDGGAHIANVARPTVGRNLQSLRSQAKICPVSTERREGWALSDRQTVESATGLPVHFIKRDQVLTCPIAPS